jgi:uncharacterized protein with HEPN domain
LRAGDTGLDLEIMLDAPRSARRFIDGLTEDEFLAEELHQSAVSMCLVVIGECAKRLTRQNQEFAAEHDLDGCAIASLTAMRHWTSRSSGRLRQGTSSP